MTDTLHLEKKIKESGKKKEYLAEKLSLTRQGFYNKCQGLNEFTAFEIKILCEELNILDLSEKEAIFFAN